MYRSGAEDAGFGRRARRDIARLPERFARGRTPERTLAIVELPQWQTDPVLVDTAGSYAESRQYCQADGAGGDEDAPDKGSLWHEHSVCGGVEALPEDFFDRPPYLHLSGRSYAALAAERDPGRFGTVEWLGAHRHLLHVAELGEVSRRGVRLDAAERLAAALSPEALRALIEGTSPVLGAGRLFVARRTSHEPAETVYAVFPRSAWDRFLEATPLTAAPLERGDSCLAVAGALCFEASAERLRRRIDLATALGAGSFLLLALGAVAGALRRARARRREQDARLFILQTLSHEIRTPATSLALSLEPIRRRFDDLPDEVQPAFLRLCDGVQRLQRVVEASTQYLRGELGEQDIRLHHVLVPSVDDFVQSVLDGYDRAFEVTLLGAPTPVHLDPYWVGVCIRNLVDNAIAHGAEPIAVRLARRGGDLIVSVEDGGDSPPVELAELTRPFARGPRSRGLGFGLAVVRRLATAMRGQLVYEQRPKRFALVLPVVAT